MDTERYQIGSLLLDAGTQEVSRHGDAVPLPPLSFSLLLTLARHAPNVVTTSELEAEVWSGLVVDRGTINKRVVLVRNALRKAGCERDYIAVVRGTGYRLAVPVRALRDESDSGAEAPDSPTTAVPAELAAPRQSVTPWVVAAVAVVLSAVLLLRQGFEPDGDAFAGKTDAPATSGGVPGFTAGSLAVLPFVQDGSTEEDRFIAEGVAQDLARLLSERTSLQVVATQSSFALAESGAEPAEIARRLNADVLLDGRVEREGDQFALAARLVKADDATVIWSDSYTYSLADMADAQGEVAREVALALQAPASTRGVALVAATTNVDAYTEYLKGRALLEERLERGGDAVRAGLERFEAAVRLDPAFVRGHVGVAAASLLMPFYDEGLDETEWRARAEASARMALDLAPDSPDALGVLAAVTFTGGDPLQAAGLFDRALLAGNRDPDVLHWHAMLATSMGYFDGLLPTLREAYRLDPLNPMLGCSLAGSLNFSGHPEQALRVLDGMQRFDRRDLAAAIARLYLGDWDDARALLSGIRLRAGPLPPEFADLLVGAFEAPPRRAFVEQTFIDAVGEGSLERLVAFEALLILGSPRAFDLEVSLEGSWFEHWLPEAVWHNWGVDLRRDPRFKGWVRALGYDQYWRQYGWPDRCRPTGLDDFECV